MKQPICHLGHHYLQRNKEDIHYSLCTVGTLKANVKSTTDYSDHLFISPISKLPLLARNTATHFKHLILMLHLVSNTHVCFVRKMTFIETYLINLSLYKTVLRGLLSSSRIFVQLTEYGCAGHSLLWYLGVCHALLSNPLLTILFLH